ncbi:MAG: homoserine kinase [Rubrivivax sp.]|nr:homoserine kinase [Rubrivivax sp.]
MAVYTPVQPEEADVLMRRLGLGDVLHLEGIRSGIENTNYFVTTTQGRWVLTLFERLSTDELPYFLKLMGHLAGLGLPVPAPQADRGGRLVHPLAGKPAAVVTRLQGQPVIHPEPAHCAQLGTTLGRMHVAAASFEGEQAHGRGLAWCRQVLPQLHDHVPAAIARRLEEELAYQQAVADSQAGRALPRGPIHADLFRDNTLFEATPAGDRLSGVLDFYFAGTDSLLFDLAVCVNDWCIDEASGRIDDARALALLNAYRAERPMAHGEWRLLPALLRAAALRFWISRLWDWYLPRPASLLVPKNPEHFERVLRQRTENPWLPLD